MHIQVFKKNEKKIFEGGPKKFRKKFFLPPLQKFFFWRGKNQTVFVPNLNKIRPAVPKLQPIEIAKNWNFQNFVLQLEAEPVKLEQPNFDSKNLGVVSNIPSYQKNFRVTMERNNRGGHIWHISWPRPSGQVGLRFATLYDPSWNKGATSEKPFYQAAILTCPCCSVQTGGGRNSNFTGR